MEKFTPTDIDAMAQELITCATYLPLRTEVCDTLRKSARLLAVMKIALMDECFDDSTVFKNAIDLACDAFERRSDLNRLNLSLEGLEDFWR